MAEQNIYLFSITDVDLVGSVEMALTTTAHAAVIEDNYPDYPSFRVMIGAEEDGPHLMAWATGTDLAGSPQINFPLS